MPDFEPLKIPKRDRKKGEYIFCTMTGCNTNVMKKCSLSGKALHTCKHPESHHFQSKATHPVSGRTVPIKTYGKDLRDYKVFSALHQQELQQFESNSAKPVVKIDSKKPSRLQDAIRMYFDWYQDEGVPEFEKKRYSPSTIKDELNSLKIFIEALKAKGFVYEALLVKDVNKYHVEAVHNYLLQDKGYSNSTYNNKFDTINRFFNFLIKERNYGIKNPFGNVKNRPSDPSKVFVEMADFENLLSILTIENGIKFEKDGDKIKRKSLYREWLGFYYRLALYTGGRPEGLMNLKLEDVQENFTRVYDWKVSRKKKTDQIRLVIRTKEFNALLEELNNFYNLSPQDYLIAPEIEKRTTVKNHASKAFTHYWRQVGAEYKATLYDLKDTHITLMLQRFGSMYEGIYGAHDSFKTSLENYAKEEVMIRELKGKSMFG